MLATLRTGLTKGLTRDLTASIVVFLVAMPLCMGIAVASGVPPERGLITGIVGGILVGMLAGSPLQVSGPAAGLAVLVFELVREHGLAALGPILLVAGAIQFVAGVLRLGGWFRAISPAVVHGMLAGIGALIVIAQFHVLFDAKPMSNGIENLAAMPGRLFGLDPTNLRSTELALIVGIATIVAMLMWEKWRPAQLRLVPGALVGVTFGTSLAMFAGFDVKHVTVPSSIIAAIAPPGGGALAGLLDPGLLATALAIAFIASAETLLSAAAVDRMHDGPRTDYNKELRAQGIGNFVCGLAGALPMTGVIVRSSANVQAGAVTRKSAILHGVWILGFVVLLPFILRQIPMAALGGILVVTGWRLVGVSHVRHLFHHHGLLPAMIWVATFVMVVATDLLTGVLTGLALSAIEILPHIWRLKLNITDREGDHARELEVSGAATFLSLPRLTERLEALPSGRPVRVDMTHCDVIDHTCAEMFAEWLRKRRKAGDDVELTDPPHKLARLIA